MLRSLDQNQEMRALLIECGEQFAFYAREHHAKITATRVIPMTQDEIDATLRKAKVNEGFARRVNELLNPPAPPMIPIDHEAQARLEVFMKPMIDEMDQIRRNRKR